MATDEDNPEGEGTAELRRRTLEEDQLSRADLYRRKRKASQMRYGILLVPLVLILLAPAALTRGVSMPMAVGSILICIGAAGSYRIGTTAERHY